MTAPNRPVENPVTGHQVTFLQTADQTNGELLRIEYVVPGPEEPLQYIPLHFHRLAEERFATIAGELGVMMGRAKERRLLGVGEEVVIPPGTAHAFWNAGDSELRFITDVRPAGQLQTYWETAFGLAAEGKVDDKGVVHFWQLVALFPVMDTYVPGLPAGLQRLVFGGLGWFSHRLGYRAVYPQYSSV